MKKYLFPMLLLAFFAIGFVASDDDDTNTVIDDTEQPTEPEEPEIDNGITALANLNPEEPIILDVSNEKGECVVLMGSKDATGQPEKLEQMLIKVDGEENNTEVFFDEKENIKEMIAPNGVRFQFEWLSDTEATLTLIEPNTNEQINTVIDFSGKNNSEENNEVAQSRGSVNEPRTGDISFTLEPISDETYPNDAISLKTRASSGSITGDVYLEQCGSPATAQCWVDVYNYSDLTGSYGRGKYRGRFSCTKVGDGHYQFSLPQNYNEHHNIADYCDGINNVVDKVCGLNAWTAPGSGTKEYLCVAIAGYLAMGIVTAEAAGLFLLACEGISGALDTACSLINGNMDLPEGTPTILDGGCAWLREMDLTWDTPLFLVPVVNALPSCIYGTTQKFEAGGTLAPMYITWGGNPVINSFTLNPPKPAHHVSYQAIAELACVPVGTKVTMDIVGTDGYSKSETSTVGSGQNINYRATMTVPGAATAGIKDVCTVTAVTPSGETVSKKASLIFQ